MICVFDGAERGLAKQREVSVCFVTGHSTIIQCMDRVKDAGKSRGWRSHGV